MSNHTQTLTHVQPVSVLRMADRCTESAVSFLYRGRMLEVLWLPDEDGATPYDGDHEFSLTAAQIEAWERGEWWYHHMLINELDAEGEWLDYPGEACSSSYSRLPSFMDHNALIFSQCDQLCDALELLPTPDLGEVA